MNIKEEYQEKIKELIKNETKKTQIKEKIEQESLNIMMCLMQDKTKTSREKVELYNYVEDWKHQAINAHLAKLDQERQDKIKEKKLLKEKEKNDKIIKKLNEDIRKRQEERKEMKIKSYILVCYLMSSIIFIMTICCAISMS